jgi:hypothetical protein
MMTSQVMEDDDGWGRVLRYAMLGPLFGAVAVLCNTISFSGRAANVIPESLGVLFLLIYIPVMVAPIAYVVGFLPAVIVGLLDRLLWKWRVNMVVHVGAVTIAGFAICYLPLWLADPRQLTLPWQMGKVGAIASFCCCLWCLRYFGRLRLELPNT